MTIKIKSSKPDRKSQPQHLYTLEEFEQMPEFGERFELSDGRLMEKTVPTTRHSHIIDLIRNAIRNFDPEGNLGFSLQEASINLGPRNSPIPDISFWRAARNVGVNDSAGPLPDMAVEVHSPGDLVSPSALERAMLKVKKLLEAGVPLVWVVYPDRQEVAVYRAAVGYEAGPVERLGVGKELSGEDVIPGFKLPVAALFA